MDFDALYHTYNESGFRIRCMRSQAEQVKYDFTDLTILLERLESGTLDVSELEQILQKISWIKHGIYIIKKLSMVDIEGVLWGEIEKIESDVQKLI